MSGRKGGQFTYFGAARDIFAFEIEGDGFFAPRSKPIHHNAHTVCKNDSVQMINFAWGYQNGQAPYKSTCRLINKSDESTYSSAKFQHHDCDTSTGSSGALLQCLGDDGELHPTAIHSVGWGSDERLCGAGVYNIAVPLDPQMLRTLHRALTTIGD